MTRSALPIVALALLLAAGALPTGSAQTGARRGVRSQAIHQVLSPAPCE